MPLFNEKKLKEAVKEMTEETREKCTNDFIDMLGMPDSLKQGNKNIDTAYGNLGTAITFVRSSPLITQEEKDKFEDYIDGISPEI